MFFSAPFYFLDFKLIVKLIKIVVILSGFKFYHMHRLDEILFFKNQLININIMSIHPSINSYIYLNFIKFRLFYLVY